MGEILAPPWRRNLAKGTDTGTLIIMLPTNTLIVLPTLESYIHLRPRQERKRESLRCSWPRSAGLPREKPSPPDTNIPGVLFLRTLGPSNIRTTTTQ
ncbi:hypothetical protein LX36DRAFT_382375 [Colletotrichum falcatum]|nr:hypothetical protein LX36DRAFT_382375 [Colletotrichum falcatum]